MIRSRTYLDDRSVPLVLDPSATLTLLATGVASEVFAALENRVLVADLLAAEFQGTPPLYREQLAAMIGAGRVEVRTTDWSDARLLGVVSGSASTTLDDGEAASMFLACNAESMFVSDDRKIERLCQDHCKGALVTCTFDILALKRVGVALGEGLMRCAVRSALADGLVVTPSRHAGWVRDLLLVRKPDQNQNK